MNKYKLLSCNLQRINGMYNILKYNRECGWENYRISVKAVELVLESIRNLYNILDKLLNLTIDIDEYNSYIEIVFNKMNEYPYKIDESCFISIKEKLYRIIQELTNLGLGYEDISHTCNTYIIINNYIWNNDCDNEPILKISYEAILKTDILLINSMFSNIFKFILENSRLINRIYSNTYIQQLAFEPMCREVNGKQLRDLFIQVDRASRRQQNDNIIDMILKICIEINNLIY